MLERIVGGAPRVPNHDLLDLGARGVGLLADARDVDRHLPPAIDRIARVEDLRLDDLAATFLRAEVGLGHEHLADRDQAGLQRVAAARDDGGEKVLRDLDVDAGAVAGLAVRVDRAAMPDRAQGVDARLDHVAASLAIQRRDQADAARVVLVDGRVGAGECRAVGVPRGEELWAGLEGGIGH